MLLSNKREGRIKRIGFAQDGLCAYCKEPWGDNPTVDHIVPLSRGGANSAKNLVIACGDCNELLANHTHPNEVIDRMKRVIELVDVKQKIIKLRNLKVPIGPSPKRPRTPTSEIPLPQPASSSHTQSEQTGHSSAPKNWRVRTFVRKNP